MPRRKRQRLHHSQWDNDSSDDDSVGSADSAYWSGHSEQGDPQPEKRPPPAKAHCPALVLVAAKNFCSVDAFGHLRVESAFAAAHDPDTTLTRKRRALTGAPLNNPFLYDDCLLCTRGYYK